MAPTTPSWIVEEHNRTGWVMYVGVNEKPSLARPESYFTCELPHLNDPIRVSMSFYVATLPGLKS